MVDIFLFEFSQDRVARKVGSGGTAKRRRQARPRAEPDNGDGGIRHVAAAGDRECAGAVLGIRLRHRLDPEDVIDDRDPGAENERANAQARTLSPSSTQARMM